MKPDSILAQDNNPTLSTSIVKPSYDYKKTFNADNPREINSLSVRKDQLEYAHLIKITIQADYDEKKSTGRFLSAHRSQNKADLTVHSGDDWQTWYLLSDPASPLSNGYYLKTKGNPRDGQFLHYEADRMRLLHSVDGIKPQWVIRRVTSIVEPDVDSYTIGIIEKGVYKVLTKDPKDDSQIILKPLGELDYMRQAWQVILCNQDQYSLKRVEYIKGTEMVNMTPSDLSRITTIVNDNNSEAKHSVETKYSITTESFFKHTLSVGVELGIKNSIGISVPGIADVKQEISFTLKSGYTYENGQSVQVKEELTHKTDIVVKPGDKVVMKVVGKNYATDFVYLAVFRHKKTMREVMIEGKWKGSDVNDTEYEITRFTSDGKQTTEYVPIPPRK